MPEPIKREGYDAKEIHAKITLLGRSLVNLDAKTTKFTQVQKLPDGRVVNAKSWNDWEWAHGIGLYGLYQYHAFSGSNVTLRVMQDWFRARMGEGTGKNVNTMAVFLTLAYLYEETGEMSYLPWLDAWAEWLINDLPRTMYGGFQHVTYSDMNENQLWDDTLMMAVMPLAKIGMLLNRPKYVEEAKRQFLLHTQYLFDRETGLFFHGWQFDTNAPGGVGHNFAKARWARGNSWLTIAIPDFLELLDLPAEDPIRLYLISMLQLQCAALKKLQAENGMWRTLLDVSVEDGSYYESSATAGIAYGMLKSIRRRYISREYEECAIKAVKAVISKISDTGELGETSVGTRMGQDLDFYKQIPLTPMPYGQAMAIMALGEFLRTFI